MSIKVWKASPEYSICHQWFNHMLWSDENTFCMEINKNTTLFNIRHSNVSSVSQSSVTLTQGCVFFVDLRSDLNANSAPLWPGWYRRVYAFCVQGIISKMALHWHRGDVTVPNCWITLWLNHWWQMEYPGDAFHTFMDLDSAIYSHKPPGFHPKYLKLCSED